MRLGGIVDIFLRIFRKSNLDEWNIDEPREVAMPLERQRSLRSDPLRVDRCPKSSLHSDFCGFTWDNSKPFSNSLEPQICGSCESPVYLAWNFRDYLKHDRQGRSLAVGPHLIGGYKFCEECDYRGNDVPSVDHKGHFDWLDDGDCPVCGAVIGMYFGDVSYEAEWRIEQENSKNAPNP